MKHLARTIFLILFLSIVIKLPITANATTAPSGAGTSGDPYLISNLANLEWMRDEVNDGLTGVDLSYKYFKQTADIDLASITNWVPIGDGSKPFKGFYDGNGYRINNMGISNSSYYVGLFGYLDGNGTYVKNLGIVNANVTSTNLYGYTGILAGSSGGSVNLSNIFTTGNVTLSCSTCGSSYAYIGGIIGNQNGGTLSSSFSSASVYGNNNNYWINAGGLVGGIDNVIVSNCFYNGNTVQGWYKGRLFGSVSRSTLSNLIYTTETNLNLPYLNYVEPTPVDTINSVDSTILNAASTYTSTDYFSTVWDSSKWQFIDGSLPNLIPPSNNANLLSITFSTGIINFAQNTTSYSFSVANSINSITVTPTTNESHATVKVNGTSVSSGSASGSLSLNTGVNTITVVVTAQDGSTTKTYTITVNRGSETHLSSFLFKTALVTTNTDAISTCSDTSYVTNCTVDLSTFSSYDIEDHDYIIVTPTAIDSEATITQMSNIAQATLISNGMPTSQINLSDSPSQTITFYVTSSNGQSGRTYNLTITRPFYTVSTLSNLALSTGTLSFNPQVQTYNLTVPNTITAMSLTPTLTKSLSTLSVNGVTNANATASTLTSLVEGLNTFNVLVTAEDGITTQTYTVNVTREVPIVVPTINTATSVLSSNEQLPNTGVGSGLFGLVPLGLAMLSLTRRRMSK